MSDATKHTHNGAGVTQRCGDHVVLNLGVTSPDDGQPEEVNDDIASYTERLNRHRASGFTYYRVTLDPDIPVEHETYRGDNVTIVEAMEEEE